MTSYVRHVAIRFSIAGFVTLLGIGLPIMLGPLMRGLLPILGTLLGFIVSGTVGGAALNMGKKVICGFSIGFLVPGVVVPITLVSLQAMTGKENPFGLILFFALSFGFGFGVAGGIGAAFMRKGFRPIKASMSSFGISGALGGIISLLPFLVMRGEANYGGLGKVGVFLTYACLVIGLLVSYSVGGFLLARKAEKMLALVK